MKAQKSPSQPSSARKRDGGGGDGDQQQVRSNSRQTTPRRPLSDKTASSTSPRKRPGAASPMINKQKPVPLCKSSLGVSPSVSKATTPIPTATTTATTTQEAIINTASSSVTSREAPVPVPVPTVPTTTATTTLHVDDDAIQRCRVHWSAKQGSFVAISSITNRIADEDTAEEKLERKLGGATTTTTTTVTTATANTLKLRNKISYIDRSTQTEGSRNKDTGVTCEETTVQDQASSCSAWDVYDSAIVAATHTRSISTNQITPQPPKAASVLQVIQRMVYQNNSPDAFTDLRVRVFFLHAYLPIHTHDFNTHSINKPIHSIGKTLQMICALMKAPSSLSPPSPPPTAPKDAPSPPSPPTNATLPSLLWAMDPSTPRNRSQGWSRATLSATPRTLSARSGSHPPPSPWIFILVTHR